MAGKKGSLRSQPYRFKWPLTPSQVEGIDESFQILFDALTNGTVNVSLSSLTVSSTTINNVTTALSPQLAARIYLRS